MRITDALLTMGSEHGRTGQALNAKGITVHYVGNPGSSAEANRNWFENGAGGAHSSAHYIIGLKGEILRIIPEAERAQHAGKSYAKAYDKTAKTNNSTYIGIECCHPGADGKFNEATVASLTELCADICRRRGFDPVKNIVRHYDITAKKCPAYYVNDGGAWEGLLAGIDNLLNGGGEDLGTVKVKLEEKIYDVKAENTGGSWYIPIEGLDGVVIRLADALSLAGYSASWDAENETVVAEKKAEY